MQVSAFFAVLAIAVMASPSRAAEPIDIPAFMAIPRPAPMAEIRYGPEATQAIDLFLPAGSGLFPVVVLIHGGCWSVKTAAREQLRHLGADLARRGIAVWSIGYRRADEVGGGYPGTYQDVGIAIDRLRDEARRYRLDLSRTVLVGHSAGGQPGALGCGPRSASGHKRPARRQAFRSPQSRHPLRCRRFEGLRAARPDDLRTRHRRAPCGRTDGKPPRRLR